MLYNKRGDVPEKSVLALETMGRKRGWERMIIWISGAYGVGKSTLAEALAGRMGDALVFDAEEVGNAVRESVPDDA